MRSARGSRSLRLPCVLWLLLSSLLAGSGLSDGAATARREDDASGDAAISKSIADLASHPLDVELEVTDVSEEGRTARRGRTESTEQRSGKRLDEDEASRILWRGWLLVDETASRRKAHITPKSVFIAPVIRGDGTRGGIPACAEGYRSDAMGRCHKVVRVNPAAHLDFLLQRLNALYGEPSSGSSQGESDKGPLLVTIPIATDQTRGSEEGAEEGGEEDEGRVDLVVVAEASIQEGPFKDLTASFTGFEEQVVSEIQGEPNETESLGSAENITEKKVVNKSSSETFESELGEIETVEVKNGSDDRGNGSVVKPKVVVPLTNSPVISEPVTLWESINSTEESGELTENPVTESTTVPTTGDPNDRFVQTTITTDITGDSSEDIHSEGTTSDVHFTNTHIYETTFITDYPTTDSYDDKVTVTPENLHKTNQGESIEDSSSIRNKSDVKRDPPSRIVFPGKVSERVRFPDSEDQEASHSSPAVSSASSVETPSVTSLTSSKPVNRPWGGWNRPMLLKFWTQMPLIREPNDDLESTRKRASLTASNRDTAPYPKRGESWSFPVHGGAQGQIHTAPYQRRPWIQYQEISPREMASVSRIFDRVRHFDNHG